MPDDQLRVAFLGLGLMGRPMAANLARAGFPLTLWNRSPQAAEALTADLAEHAVDRADRPADAARAADVVITMLADGTALTETYHGAGGVLMGLRPGAVAVDMGTSGPAVVQRLAEEVRAAGGVLVDAPVSGSTAAAQAASLTVLAAGEPAAVERVRPVLQAMGRTVHHVGPSGAGAALKLALNAALFALTESVAEALVLAERSGVDPAVAYDVFADSAIAAPAVHYRRDAFLDPEGTPPSFRLALAAKDLRLLHEHAGRVGAPVPLAGAVAGVVQAAVDDGFGSGDLAALATWLRGRPG